MLKVLRWARGEKDENIARRRGRVMGASNFHVSV